MYMHVYMYMYIVYMYMYIVYMYMYIVIQLKCNNYNDYNYAYIQVVMCMGNLVNMASPLCVCGVCADKRVCIRALTPCSCAHAHVRSIYTFWRKNFIFVSSLTVCVGVGYGTVHVPTYRVVSSDQPQAV